MKNIQLIAWLALGSLSTSAHGAPVKIQGMAAGVGHVCALLIRGDVKCWGSNHYGQLGLEDDEDRGDEPNEMGNALPAVDLEGQVVVQIAAGGYHTCTRLENGVVKCWGRNDHGQLGLEDIVQRGDDANEMGAHLPAVNLGDNLLAKKLEAGGAHTCAILTDDSLKCWGENSSGQLGEGSAYDRGNAGGEMGNFRPAIDLGTGRYAVQVSLGWSHTCALLDDASVKCWGGNSLGQLGLGDSNNRGDQDDEMGDALAAVELGAGRTAVRIQAGHFHTCALLDDDSVKCWGANSDGQLGVGDMNARGLASVDMGNNLDAVSLASPSSGISRIGMGGRHGCAIYGTTLKCWGDNSSGQLGAGHRNDLGNASGEMGNSLPAIDLGAPRYAAIVAGGWGFTCAGLDNHRIKCWGDNGDGQLGQGDNVTRGAGAGEMGSALPVIDLGTR